MDYCRGVKLKVAAKGNNIYGPAIEKCLISLALAFFPPEEEK